MNGIDRRRLLATAASALFPATATAKALPLTELPGQVSAPELALPDRHGAIHRLSDYRGHAVLVSFWAVWCSPCRRELPALSDLVARLKDTKIEVFAVDLGDGAERIDAFLADHPAPNLPVLLDGEKSSAAPWHVKGLPVAYAADANGILRLGALGERDWRAPVIERQLRSLV